MRKHIGMQGKLAGPQGVVNGVSHLFGANNFLIQHGHFIGFFPLQLSDVVGTRQELHRGVFFVGIVNGQPYGYGPGWA